MLTVPTQHIGELLERDAELSVVADLVQRAARGVGGALVIEGEPGVGKTSLLEAASESARERPVRLLRARGGELERSFPFGVASTATTDVAGGYTATATLVHFRSYQAIASWPGDAEHAGASSPACGPIEVVPS